MNTNWCKVSDGALKAEYHKRFFIKAGEVIGDSKKAVNHLRTFFADSQDRECFVVVFLNAGNEHIKTELIFTGSIDSSVVYPREVIKKILEYNATGIIVSHNHPSGALNASKDDVRITKKLKTACESIGAILRDHIIISSKGYLSLAEEGTI